MKGNELNERQAKVLTLRQQGKTWAEIGRALEITRSSAQQAYNSAVVKTMRAQRQEASEA